MSSYVIREFGDFSVKDAGCFDLTKTQVKDCIGCFSCWWKTPGCCIHNDLKEYFEGYINADRVLIFAKLENGFFSAAMKRLFDRTIPLFLPYTRFRDGGTFHSKRYNRYPNIEIFYDGTFEDEEEKEIFYDYAKKVFEQFLSREITIRPVSEFGGAQ